MIMTITLSGLFVFRTDPWWGLFQPDPNHDGDASTDALDFVLVLDGPCQMFS
jgi:hypothetical protein